MWIKLFFYILLIMGAVFLVMYIADNRSDVKSLDVLFQKYFYKVKDGGSSSDANCVIYYQPEEIFNLNSYIHSREKVCEKDIFIVDPALVIQEGNNIGRMKFFLLEVDTSTVQINHFENEVMTNNFRTGNFEQIPGERLYIKSGDEKCVIANRYVPQDNVKYCFVYDNDRNLILNIMAE